MTPTRDDLRTLVRSLTGGGAIALEPMAGGGSSRRFYRIRSGEGLYVGAICSQMAEARAFLGFTEHFAAKGIPVPKIIGRSDDGALYVMEDLGPHTLAARLAQWRGQPEGHQKCLAALREVVRWLPVIQIDGGDGLNYGLCHEGAELDAEAFRADLAQFVECYANRVALSHGPSTETLKDMRALSEELGRLDRKHFCYRDFQTRNIMWHDEAPVFIDYQSGRHGPLAYDLAALLYSPDSGLDDPGRTILIGDYLDALSARGVRRSRDGFEQELYLAVTVRRLQALGAYARLAYGQGQTQYLEKIPPAWVALRSLLERNLICAARPALRKWLLTLASSGFKDRESGNQVLGSSPGE